MPNRREDAFNGIRRAQVLPMLSGEIVEGQQRFAILSQAFNRFAVLYAVFFGEDVERRFRSGPVRRQADFAQVLLHFRLHRERDLIEYIDSFVQPTSLVTRAGEDLLDRLPKAESAVTNRNFRGHVQPAAFQVDEQLAPALSAFSTA